MKKPTSFTLFHVDETRKIQDFMEQYKAKHPDIDLDDPLTDALLAGVAFLNARTATAFEESKQNLAQGLLQVAYPHLSNPAHVPVLLFQADIPATVSTAQRLKRLQSLSITDSNEYANSLRVGLDTELLPIKLVEVQLENAKGQAVMTLRFEAFEQVERLSDIALQNLRLFLGEDAERVAKLQNLLFKHCVAIRLGRNLRDSRPLMVPLKQLVQTAFLEDSELLSYPGNTEPGYRLLSEFYQYPEKHHFIDIQGLAPYLQQLSGTKFCLSFYFDCSVEQIDIKPNCNDFSLNVLPLVNLFLTSCWARHPMSDGDYESVHTLQLDPPEGAVFFAESLVEHNLDGRNECQALHEMLRKDSSTQYWQARYSDKGYRIALLNKDGRLPFKPDSTFQAMAWCYNDTADDDDWSTRALYQARFDDPTVEVAKEVRYRYLYSAGTRTPKEEPWAIWRLFMQVRQQQQQTILKAADKTAYLRSVIELAGVLTANTQCSDLAKSIKEVTLAERVVPVVIQNQQVLKRRFQLLVTIAAECRFSEALLEQLLATLVNYELFEPLVVSITKEPSADV